MIYMKGVPDLPRCGFSSLAVRVLKEYSKCSIANFYENTHDVFLVQQTFFLQELAKFILVCNICSISRWFGWVCEMKINEHQITLYLFIYNNYHNILYFLSYLIIFAYYLNRHEWWYYLITHTEMRLQKHRASFALSWPLLLLIWVAFLLLICF